jgi:hypothetical protein|tara:strand:- start:4040 stop:4582 length:543 start_codon:yes stop_codon:yes gene_type:complete
MEKLPIRLQILNDFIWEKPQVVVKLLKENGIKVSSKPTLPEIIRKSVQAVTDENQGFIDDVDREIKTEGESGIIFTTALVVSSLISIGGAILGASQAKKQRKAMLNMKLMELASNEKLTYANIQAMKEQGRIEILTNTLLEYGKALQSESTQRQKDTGLFIGIMGVGLAVVYATTQIFKE